MRKLMITVAVAVLMTAPLLAAEKSDKADVMGVVNQLVDAFNKGDSKPLLAASADDMSIIDEFPPHEWHGAGTCSKWLAGYDANAKKNGITDGIVGIGKPRHVDVTGDRAYVVVPAWYTWKQNGKAKKETNATWTLTLQKGNDGWRVTGWSWAKP